MSCNGSHRSKLSVRVVGTEGASCEKPPHNPDTIEPPVLETREEEILNISAFKASLPLFPLMKPFNGTNASDSKAKL